MKPPRREVARALLFDPRRRILLVHWRDPVTARKFWEPPGGGREEGETYVDALRREVAEETGFTEIAIGAFVKDLDHSFTFAGQLYDCRERYFICRLIGEEAAEPRRDVLETAGILGVRWFGAEELKEMPPDQLEPPELLSMLRLAEARSASET